MANEKMDLIKHMALLRNIANDVTAIMSSTGAADFINAAIEIINDYPSDGKLVDTGNSGLNIPGVINFQFLLADGSKKLIAELNTKMQAPIINQYVHLDKKYQVTAVHHDYINKCVKIYCL